MPKLRNWHKLQGVAELTLHLAGTKKPNQAVVHAVDAALPPWEEVRLEPQNLLLSKGLAPQSVCEIDCRNGLGLQGSIKTPQEDNSGWWLKYLRRTRPRQWPQGSSTLFEKYVLRKCDREV